jgi:hypothetical protein
MPPRGGKAAAAAAAPAGTLPLIGAMSRYLDAARARDMGGVARAYQDLGAAVFSSAALAGRTDALACASGEALLARLAESLASPCDATVRAALEVVLCVAAVGSAVGPHLWPLLVHPRATAALAALLRDPARLPLHGAMACRAVCLLVRRASAAALAAAFTPRGGLTAIEAAMADAAAAWCADGGAAAARAAREARQRAASALSMYERKEEGRLHDPLCAACGTLEQLARSSPGGVAAAQRRLLAHPRLLAALVAAAAAPGAAFGLLCVLCGWAADNTLAFPGSAAEALRVAPGLPLAAGRLLAAARGRGGDSPAMLLVLLRDVLNAGPPADACVAVASDGSVLSALQWYLVERQQSAQGGAVAGHWLCPPAAAHVLGKLAGQAAEAAGHIARAPGMLEALLRAAMAPPSQAAAPGQPAFLLSVRASTPLKAAEALTSAVAAGGPPARRQLRGLMAAAPRLAAGLGHALRRPPVPSMFQARPDSQKIVRYEQHRTQAVFAQLAAAILADDAPGGEADADEAAAVPDALLRRAGIGRD